MLPLVVGMIFNTRVCEGVPSYYWVLFSIPTKEKGCSFVVIGALSRVPGMIFNTCEGGGGGG